MYSSLASKVPIKYLPEIWLMTLGLNLVTDMNRVLQLFFATLGFPIVGGVISYYHTYICTYCEKVY